VAAALPAARLVIAGSGPEESALRAMVTREGMGERVEFAGRLSRDEMAARYRAASVALNPSRVDNMPNSLLEALASGVPIVSTDAGGIPHVVAHERTALLVPPGDAQAMADALLRILRDPPLAARLAAAGTAEAQRYAWASVREALAAVYASVLGGAVVGMNPA
jgi:glycosyltransferase involved in cell wall biosynthesis